MLYGVLRARWAFEGVLTPKCISRWTTGALPPEPTTPRSTPPKTVYSNPPPGEGEDEGSSRHGHYQRLGLDLQLRGNESDAETSL